LGEAGLLQSVLKFLPFLVVPLLLPGCRRVAPPSFTPSAEVRQLTEELEDADPEELEIYQQLQQEIATQLQQRTGTPQKPILLGTDATTDQLQLGYSLYSNYCVQCHGVNGDGQGAVAQHLHPKPRDYTQGVFKFTSTPYGSKPRRADLARTVRIGVTGTSMPSFDRFSKAQVEAVVDYVLALTFRGQLQRQLASYAYEDEELPDAEGLETLIAEILAPWQASSGQVVMPVSLMPPLTAATVRQGHQVFLSQACNKCHGQYGRGGSMGNVEVGKDAWGNQAAAADLSSGMFHGGDRPIDIYRRIYSGINGTPMPAFGKTFQDNPEAIWHLVHFIKTTGNRRRLGLPPLSEADLPPAEPSAPAARSPESEEAPLQPAA
jgi:mono/diheme cytochrome c family protein